MNSTTEICNKNGSQMKIYHQSKQYGGKSVQKLTKKMKTTLIYLRVWVEFSALTKMCDVLAVKQENFISYKQTNTYLILTAKST